MFPSPEAKFPGPLRENMRENLPVAGEYAGEYEGKGWSIFRLKPQQSSAEDRVRPHQRRIQTVLRRSPIGLLGVYHVTEL